MAFHIRNCVGTRDDRSFAVQWLACALPCRRFAGALAGVCARLGADVDRYSFTVRDLHPLLLAGLPAHSENLHRSRHSPMDRRFITAAEIPISNVMEPQCLLGHLTRTVLTPSRRVPQLLLRHENLTDCQSAFKFDPGSAFNTPLCATGLTVALV